MSLLDNFEAWKNRKEYEKNFDKNKTLSLLLYSNKDSIDKNVARGEHPLHQLRLAEYKKHISLLSNKDLDINFGDSLTDLARKQLAFSHDAIFSISGSWAHHMKQMAIDLAPDLERFNIKNISIGCLGGNPMLAYQTYAIVLQESLQTLNTIRKLFPSSKIIVYGLPSVFAIYVSQNTYEFDNELKKWVANDKNSSFISLKENFGSGWRKIFPSTKYSSDGVHFNPRGAAEFSKLIENEQI